MFRRPRPRRRPSSGRNSTRGRRLRPRPPRASHCRRRCGDRLRLAALARRRRPPQRRRRSLPPLLPRARRSRPASHVDSGRPARRPRRRAVRTEGQKAPQGRRGYAPESRPCAFWAPRRAKSATGAAPRRASAWRATLARTDLCEKADAPPRRAPRREPRRRVRSAGAPGGALCCRRRPAPAARRVACVEDVALPHSAQ